MLTTSRPLLGLLSLPKTNRARWYGSSARTSDLLIGHQRDHNVKQFVARESPDLRGGKYHQQQRRHLFSATRPTNQSSHENVRPGQRIVINPTGGSSDNRKKSSHKNKKNKLLQRSAQPVFIDRIHLKMRGGSGGAGGLSYFKMGSFKQRPCGGHGGTGGNVYLVTDSTLSSLKMERHHYTGQDGGRGGNSGMNGKNGKDVFVRVPCGVVVRKVLDWEEVEEFYGGEAHSLEEIDLGKDDSEDLAHVDVVSNEDSVEEEEKDSDIGFEGHGKDDSEDLAHDVVSNEANNIDIGNSLGQEDHQIDEQTASPEIDEEDGEVIYGEKDGNIEEEVEEDFDTYLERQQSSKRHRKRQRKGRGYLPSDYEEVVDQEVRSEDGMFHWSTLATNDTYDDDGNLMASTAYPGYQYGPSNPMRKTVLMADLDQPDSSLLVAEGGRAGVGNQAYARRPYFAEREANAAKKSVAGVGETTYLELELKLIADVGLVGFPNAGKSSLLSAMSKARPKIASYPFTTLLPLVGSIHYKDGYSIVMADVPGLIDGAAEGRGRGFEFLRHIERTKALVYMVDAAGVDGRDPVSDLKILGNELREYGSSGIFGENEMGGDEGEYGEEVRRRRREIMNRPSLILANKMDLIPEIDAGMGRREELLFELGNAAMEVGIVCESDDILGISAGVTGEGLQVLSKRMRQVVKDVESS